MGLGGGHGYIVTWLNGWMVGGIFFPVETNQPSNHLTI